MNVSTVLGWSGIILISKNFGVHGSMSSSKWGLRLWPPKPKAEEDKLRPPLRGGHLQYTPKFLLNCLVLVRRGHRILSSSQQPISTPAL